VICINVDHSGSAISGLHCRRTATFVVSQIRHKRGVMASQIYRNSNEQATSLSAIELLARETQRPVDEVRDVYESEFARLKQDAKINDYLVLFASRRARDVLERRRN
jgi:hypothetical protein